MFSRFKSNKLDLLWELVKTSFKMRYQNSILGVLWVLIKPYSTFIVLFFIWTNLRGDVIENYSLYLLTGIVLYTYFNELLTLGQMSLLENAHIILKVNFPRQISIISAMIGALINLGINFIFIIAAAIYVGVDLTIAGILYFIFIAIILFIFALGISLFTSIFTVRFRDLKTIFELGLFLLYWATPIFYVISTDVEEGRLQQVLKANPLGAIINQARAGLNVYGDVNLATTFLALTISVVILISGWIFFQKKVKSIAEYF